MEIKDLGLNKTLREIEFFAWDFAYESPKFAPAIYFDKDGKQNYKFKAGTHNVAVKVVDNEGLDNIEIIKLKVNGEVKRN